MGSVKPVACDKKRHTHRIKYMHVERYVQRYVRASACLDSPRICLREWTCVKPLSH